MENIITTSNGSISFTHLLTDEQMKLFNKISVEQPELSKDEILSLVYKEIPIEED
jgi:hypothetical protein